MLTVEIIVAFSGKFRASLINQTVRITDASIKVIADSITKKLDAIRGESFFDVFPEHQDIEEYMTEHGLHDEFDY